MVCCKNCGKEYDERRESCCPACGASISYSQSGEAAARAAETDFMKYADLMDDETLFYAAVCRKEGIGVGQDVAQAKELFHALALRGSFDGMYQYACMCLADKFSEETGLRWLKAAAEKGHLSSRLKLMELAGEGRVSVSGGISQGEAFSVTEGGSFAGTSEGEKNFRSLVEKGLPNVTAVFSGHGKVCSTGAGFLLRGGLVITNAHVIGEAPASVSVRFEPAIDPKTYEMQILGLFPEYDIAVLAFKGAAKERFAGRQGLFLRTGPVSYGEQVYTVGNPLGLGLSVSRGIVSCPVRETDYATEVREVVQTDITANHGNSGGALLDGENRVIGMVTFMPSAAEGGIAMCVPSKYIVEALNKM